jgi:ABC-type branched-subunit amino acid transport system permease subunit
MRTLVGAVVGFLLFAFGVPVLQSLVRLTGWFDQPNTEQACLGLILIVLCIIAAHLPVRAAPPEE